MKKAPLNEIARLLIDRGYFDRLTYLHTDSTRGEWMYYNSGCWQPDYEKMHEVALKRFFTDHKLLRAKEKNYVSDLGKLGSSRHWNSLLRILRTEPEISKVDDDFDGNKGLLNLDNGTYDLSQGIFREHRAEDMLTKKMEIQHNPEATCPLFMKFICEVLCEDQAVIGYVQRYLGYSLCTSTEEQCFLFVYGDGCNGKSVFTELFLRIFGDYGKKISTQGIIKSRSSAEMDRKEQIKADLAGTRLVFATESAQNMKLDESSIKDMTGSDTVSSRELYGNYKSYTPTYKIILEGNYLPVIQGTDHGIWRRVRLVKFGRTFTADEIDRELLAKLLLERDGIFQWILEGYKLWRSNGLGKVPESMQLEINKYRSEMDVLGEYITERLVSSKTAITESKAIYKDYLNWANEMGYKQQVTMRKITSELMKRGFARDGSNIHKPKFIGVGLLNDGS